MAKQGKVVHCKLGHVIPWSQLSIDVWWKAMERKWCGDEEVFFVSECCPECKRLASPAHVQPELARAAD